MATVFTNGCFDILHSGHYQLLLYCRHIAGNDPVYVAIDSDNRISQAKGIHRPYYDEDERKHLLMSLTHNGKLDPNGLGHFLIDWVEIFNDDDGLRNLIKAYQPDYIIKGEDWRGKSIVGDDLARIHFAPTYYKDFFSTSAIENRILERHRFKE